MDTRNVPLISIVFLRAPYNSVRHVGLLRVTVNPTIAVDCYAIDLHKACVRTKKPGGWSVLTSLKHRLDLVTAGSSFDSSESLAARSLVWVKQSVKLTGCQPMTPTDILNDGQSFSRHSSVGLLLWWHRSKCPVFYGRWRLIHLKRWKCTSNPTSYQAHITILQPFLKMMTT